MNIVVILLIIIIIILTTYLFLIKKDLKRISIDIKKHNSNNLIHSEIPIKELDNLINEINNLIKKSKAKEIDYKRKNIKIKKMMTNISHDLRTPLTSASGYIDILLNFDDKYRIDELIIIKERLKKLEDLINSFFEISKLELNNNIDLEKVNLIAIIEERIAGFYDDYNKYNRKIILENNQKNIKILSNEKMLARVFDNLINNAFKHSDSDIKIKIEKKENIKITFSNKLLDSNLDINHIFDEFYTVDISRTKGNTGLGLAICKEFIETLNGKIYALKNDDSINIIIELKDDD